MTLHSLRLVSLKGLLDSYYNNGFLKLINPNQMNV